MQSIAEDVALLLLSRQRWKRILDIGCGKGRFTNRLNEVTSASTVALDTSSTAVSVARSSYSAVDFLVAKVPPLPFRDESFHLVVSAELLWYVLLEMPLLFKEIKRVLRPGGYYLIIQQFYNSGEQKYGREFMESPRDLLNLLPLQLVHRIEVDCQSNHKLVTLLEKTQ